MAKKKISKWPLWILLLIAAILAESAVRSDQTKEAKMESIHKALVSGIDEAILSLSKQPNQFTLNVSTVGTQVSNSGGTGIDIRVAGGGPGSNTIGMQSAANAGNIQMSLAAADDRIRGDADKTISLLTDLKNQLESQKPEESTIKSLLGKLHDTYLAPVVTAIISKLIELRFGW